MQNKTKTNIDKKYNDIKNNIEKNNFENTNKFLALPKFLCYSLGRCGICIKKNFLAILISDNFSFCQIICLRGLCEID